MDIVDGDQADSAAALGDAEALYEREFVAMVRLAVILVGDRDRAEEIVQESFADVWSRWARIERPGAYLRRCVVNRCQRDLRRRRLFDRRAGATLADGVVDDHPRLLLDMIGHLPPRRRAIVVLRFYEDLDETQIAEALHIRPGTVRAALHQALTQLRKVIEP